MKQIKSLIRKLFYRSSLFRGAVGIPSVLTGRTRWLGMSHLLSYREDDAIGPLQRDEAIALFGIVRSLRPMTLVEFGFFHGHSAFNFLQAMPPDARLFSFDIAQDSIVRAKTEFSFDHRFTFIGKSQTEFESADIGNREIDFVFFDAAHELDLNQESFRRVECCLAAGATVAIHDTGLWHRAHFAPIHETFVREMPGAWVNEELYAHQPGEREFVDWILSAYSDFTALHFHSEGTLRHGFTLLQRKRPLGSRARSK